MRANLNAGDVVFNVPMREALNGNQLAGPLVPSLVHGTKAATTNFLNQYLLPHNAAAQCTGDGIMHSTTSTGLPQSGTAC